MKNLALILLMLTPFLAGAQKTINKSFTGIKSIKMNTSSGDIEFRKGTGNTVAVSLKYTYDDDDGYDPRIEQEGDKLIIKEKFSGRSSHGNAEWILTIPDGLNVEFSTGSGNVEVSGLSIQLDATSGSGNLEFTDMQGDLVGTTGSGNVKIENFNGKAHLKTGSGDMTLKKSQGDISLTCGSGDIRVSDSKASIKAITGSGTIDASAVTLSGPGRFTTGSGNAEVGLAATPKFDVSITSGSGTAELDFNGAEIVGEITMTASKRDGSISAPFDFDKTEEINDRGNRDETIMKTVVKGSAATKIKISTGSGDAIIKK